MFVETKCVTYHLYQALQTVMQASSSALFRYLNTDTQTSFSPPFSLPTSLKDGRDSRDGGDRENGAAAAAAASSSSDEDAERSLLPLSPWIPRRRGLRDEKMWATVFKLMPRSHSNMEVLDISIWTSIKYNRVLSSTTLSRYADTFMFPCEAGCVGLYLPGPLGVMLSAVVSPNLGRAGLDRAVFLWMKPC